MSGQTVVVVDRQILPAQTVGLEVVFPLLVDIYDDESLRKYSSSARSQARRADGEGIKVSLRSATGSRCILFSFLVGVGGPWSDSIRFDFV